MGLVYIFNYIGIRDGPSRWQYSIYYPICFFENLAAVAVWSLLAEEKTRERWYFIPLTTIPLVSFILGMIFLVLYYTIFHPNKFGNGSGKKNGSLKVIDSIELAERFGGSIDTVD